MDWYSIIVVLHVIGAAIGVGAAVSSDSVFIGSIRNRRISHDQFLLIRMNSTVVLGGLAILIITGVVLLFMNVELWSSHHFLAKMTVVIILIINGLIFHAKVLPLLAQYQHTTMPKHFIASQQWMLAITGAVSVVCWFSALIIALIGNIGLSYLVYIVLVLLLVSAGSVAAHYMLGHIVLVKGKAEPETKESGKSSTGKDISLLIVLLTILVVSLVIAAVW